MEAAEPPADTTEALETAESVKSSPWTATPMEPEATTLGSSLNRAIVERELEEEKGDQGGSMGLPQGHIIRPRRLSLLKKFPSSGEERGSFSFKRSVGKKKAGGAAALPGMERARGATQPSQTGDEEKGECAVYYVTEVCGRVLVCRFKGQSKYEITMNNPKGKETIRWTENKTNTSYGKRGGEK